MTTHGAAHAKGHVTCETRKTAYGLYHMPTVTREHSRRPTMLQPTDLRMARLESYGAAQRASHDTQSHISWARSWTATGCLETRVAAHGAAQGTGQWTVYVFFHKSTCQLLDKPWSQVSSFLSLGSCLQLVQRIGLINTTPRRFINECCQLMLSRFPQVNLRTRKFPTNVYEYTLRGTRTHETDLYQA